MDSMADSTANGSAALSSNDKLDTKLIKSLNDQCFLVYDGTRLKWTQDFNSLKNFVQNVFGLTGVWKSPGGSAKKFITSNLNLSMTWYPGKQNSLIFHGSKGESLKELLVSEYKYG